MLRIIWTVHEVWVSRLISNGKSRMQSFPVDERKVLRSMRCKVADNFLAEIPDCTFAGICERLAPASMETVASVISAIRSPHFVIHLFLLIPKIKTNIEAGEVTLQVQIGYASGVGYSPALNSYLPPFSRRLTARYEYTKILNCTRARIESLLIVRLRR